MGVGDLMKVKLVLVLALDGDTVHILCATS
jgi:hypothetical protein